MAANIVRWRPLPGLTDPPAPIESLVYHVDEDGETFYQCWPAGCSNPDGNPVKWSESTLRLCYEKVTDEAG